jgi:hypothetical protein
MLVAFQQQSSFKRSAAGQTSLGRLLLSVRDRNNMTIITVAMIKAVVASNPELGPLPKTIGRGPMKTTPPNEVEPEPTLPRMAIAVPRNIKRKPIM